MATCLSIKNRLSCINRLFKSISKYKMKYSRDPSSFYFSVGIFCSTEGWKITAYEEIQKKTIVIVFFHPYIGSYRGLCSERFFWKVSQKIKLGLGLFLVKRPSWQFIEDEGHISAQVLFLLFSDVLKVSAGGVRWAAKRKNWIYNAPPLCMWCLQMR